MIEKEIIIPENVTIDVKEKYVKVSGQKGELEKKFKYFFDIKIEKKNEKVIISSDSKRRKVKAMTGTIVAHINNLIKGVTEGFTYKMRIVYSHFPITVKVEGNKVLIHNLLGEKLPRVARIIGDTKIEVKGQDIILMGMKKEDVGQTCADIETACRISKYDRRVFQDGIYFVRE